jgi:hypothetical protein
MTREEMLAEVDQASLQLAGLRARTPSDRLLEYAEKLLSALRREVVDRWPLATPDDVAIGRFAVRAFDDGSYPELVARLVHIDVLAKGEQPGVAGG